MAYDALRTILPIAGWPAARADEVEITGGADPVLPTPFRIGAAGAAALAATGLAAADLWSLRTGRRQAVAVDLRRAVASLRSGHYMRLNGERVPTERAGVMGVYPAKHGRWSYLHCNFPNHRAAALTVLGVPEDREAVRRAVLGPSGDRQDRAQRIMSGHGLGSSLLAERRAGEGRASPAAASPRRRRTATPRGSRRS